MMTLLYGRIPVIVSVTCSAAGSINHNFVSHLDLRAVKSFTVVHVPCP